MNLNPLKKSRGVVLFAFNTQETDYVKICDLNAKCIRHFLQLPICLITDYRSIPDFDYDKVIRVDDPGYNTRYTREKNSVEWKNQNRYSAYALSPYDETVLLDVDYFQFDSSIIKLFELDWDYKMYYEMRTPYENQQITMSACGLTHLWATLILFRKTHKSKMLFELVERIQNNYDYYRALFNIRETNFRNDFAFTIANIILNGYCIDPGYNIPWSLFTIENDINEMQLNNHKIIVRHTDESILLPQSSIHIMDKKYLLSENFKNFIEKLLDEK